MALCGGRPALGGPFPTLIAREGPGPGGGPDIATLLLLFYAVVVVAFTAKQGKIEARCARSVRSRSQSCLSTRSYQRGSGADYDTSIRRDRAGKYLIDSAVLGRIAEKMAEVRFESRLAVARAKPCGVHRPHTLGLMPLHSFNSITNCCVALSPHSLKSYSLIAA